MKLCSKELVLFWGLCLMSLGLSNGCAGEWKTHEIEQLNGKAPRIKSTAQIQIITLVS